MSNMLSAKRRSHERHSLASQVPNFPPLFILGIRMPKMKTKKKRVGIGAQTRVRKETERHRTMFLAIIPIIVILSAYGTCSFLNPPKNQTIDIIFPQLKAAIVDQLSLTFPNQTFIETATNTLKTAGYTVDYYAGEQVTVEFYRNIPTHGYKMLILRVHSVADIFQGEQMVGFFTSELYSTARYVYEQLTDQIGCLGYYPGAQARYFGISQEFVKSSMNGRFDNTLVVMMGCNGLNNTRMAEAFIEKGAKVYIGWASSVSASYTDEATAHLLQHLITEKQTIKQAVDTTIEEVEPDQTYTCQLTYYPP